MAPRLNGVLNERVTDDDQYLLAAIELAWQARKHGNHPFGALLVDADGKIVAEAENTVVTGRDCTGHAETNLIAHGNRARRLRVLTGLNPVHEH